MVKCYRFFYYTARGGRTMNVAGGGHTHHIFGIATKLTVILILLCILDLLSRFENEKDIYTANSEKVFLQKL